MLRSNFLFFGSVFYKRRRDNRPIRSAAERLVAACENDLETDIYDEFVQFYKLLKTDLGKPVVEPHQSAVSVELRMYKLITGANLQTVFPNIEVGLRIYLCLVVTNNQANVPSRS